VHSLIASHTLNPYLCACVRACVCVRACARACACVSTRIGGLMNDALRARSKALAGHWRRFEGPSHKGGILLSTDISQPQTAATARMTEPAWRTVGPCRACTPRAVLRRPHTIARASAQSPCQPCEAIRRAHAMQRRQAVHMHARHTRTSRVEHVRTPHEHARTHARTHSRTHAFTHARTHARTHGRC